MIRAADKPRIASNRRRPFLGQYLSLGKSQSALNLPGNKRAFAAKPLGTTIWLQHSYQERPFIAQPSIISKTLRNED
jgi:hypothetical protein